MTRHWPNCCDSRCPGCGPTFRRRVYIRRPNLFAKGVGQGAGIAVGCMAVGIAFIAIGMLFMFAMMCR